MSKRRTLEGIKKEIYNIVGDEYTILSKEYINNKSPLEIRHNSDKCGNHIFYANFNNFVTKNTRCPECYNISRRSLEIINSQDNQQHDTPMSEILDIMKKNGYNDYKLMSYTNANNILIKHNICGREYNISKKNLIRGCKYRQCSNFKKYTIADAKDTVRAVVGDSYTILSDTYIDNKTPLKMRHNCKRCNNHEFYASLNNFLSKLTRCPECARKPINERIKEFEERFKNIFGNDFSIVEYKNSSTPALVRHDVCGTEFNIIPKDVRVGKINPKCPECNHKDKSIGETQITNLLKKHNIDFERNKYINYNGLRLYIDFYITDYHLAIEFDGVQHYYPSFGEESFKRGVERDLLKDEYCKTNNIRLIRIPFWEINKLEKIINNIVDNISSISEITDNDLGIEHEVPKYIEEQYANKTSCYSRPKQKEAVRDQLKKFIDEEYLETNYTDVYAVSFNEEGIEEVFNTRKEVVDKFGIHAPTHIMQCCNGKRPQAYGRVWRYGDQKFKVDFIASKDKKTGEVRYYKNAEAAANAIGLKNNTTLRLCLKGKKLSTRNHFWKVIKRKEDR